MKKITFDLDDKMYTELKKEANNDQRTVSQQLRIILQGRYG